MVAKFLDDNKAKTSLKKWIPRTVSNFIDLIQFLFIFKILAKLSGIESQRTISEFRKRKRKSLCCVHQLHKASAWNKDVSSRRPATTAKKCTKKRDARAKLLFCSYKPIVFLPFSLPSSSLLLKLSIVVILKCCYHGNVTSHFSSL